MSGLASVLVLYFVHICLVRFDTIELFNEIWLTESRQLVHLEVSLDLEADNLAVVQSTAAGIAYVDVLSTFVILQIKEVPFFAA
jgi:hypothetical protein